MLVKGATEGKVNIKLEFEMFHTEKSMFIKFINKRM